MDSMMMEFCSSEPGQRPIRVVSIVSQGTARQRDLPRAPSSGSPRGDSPNRRTTPVLYQDSAIRVKQQSRAVARGDLRFACTFDVRRRTKATGSSRSTFSARDAGASSSRSRLVVTDRASTIGQRRPRLAMSSSVGISRGDLLAVFGPPES
jgi:hypothetical protein